MKWHEYYSALRIRVEDIGDVDEFIWLIASNQTIKADLTIKNLKKKPDEDNPAPIFAEEAVGMQIVRIEVIEEDKEAGAWITFKTRGFLPEGVCRGTYTVKLSGCGTDEPLPQEMFEDDDVPKEALVFASQ